MSMFTVVEEQGVAVVSIDQPGSPVNILNAAAKVEFEALLERLRTDKSVRAVVLISGKPDTFIAGADIEEIVLDPVQHGVEIGVRPSVQAGDADGGVGLVDRAIAFDARVPLVHAFAGGETGRSVIAGAGGDLCESVAHEKCPGFGMQLRARSG